MLRGLAKRKRPIVIVGAGGHGREALGVVRARRLSFKGFADDSLPDLEVLKRIEAPYLGTVEQLNHTSQQYSFVIGIGSGELRSKIDNMLRSSRAAQPLVHPSAAVDQDVRLGMGTIIFAQATVTTNIEVGRHSHIGRGSAIGHDCNIGAYATVMPLASVSGSVEIGEGATIGTGAVIRQGQVIGAGAYIGAGAVVINDIDPHTVVAGNPARVLPTKRSSPPRAPLI